VHDEDFTFPGGAHGGVKRLVAQPSTSSEARHSGCRRDDPSCSRFPCLGGEWHLESLAHASQEVGRHCLGLLRTSVGQCLGAFPLLRVRHNTWLTRLARHGLRRTRRRLHCLLEVEDDRRWQGVFRSCRSCMWQREPSVVVHHNPTNKQGTRSTSTGKPRAQTILDLMGHPHVHL
jgi:hypothetical protein